MIKILIVEDEAIIAMNMKLELELQGFNVVGTAGSGSAAIFQAQQKLPDYVLMDINLIGPMDGIEAAEEIRKSIDTHILFLTGYADEIIKSRARKVHPLGLENKPVKITTLLEYMKQDTY